MSLAYLIVVFHIVVIGNKVSNCLDQSSSRSFIIDYKNDRFLKDGHPFRYISGSFHYFRVPLEYWNDRLRKAKALGLNAIQTYVAWNIHEPTPGKYNFEGDNDLLHFIQLCHQNDLLVILRPGPYIDAEWDYGGFPWWLTNHVKEFRTSRDRYYMKYVNDWFRVLFGKLKPFLYQYGGPVVMVQVENEYGNYYACDHRYMQELKDIFIKYLGDDVILFTTDGHGWSCGSLPSLYTTIDFGVDTSPDNAFKKMREFQPHGPLVNSEFYTGWQDFWGYPHSVRDATKIARHLDTMLSMNASVNLYMFQGGTNFGFMNGNDIYTDEGFIMAPTTYDYNAPLSEAGDPTSKYFVLRDVIKKYIDGPLLPVPKASEKMAYGKVDVTASWSLSQFVEKAFPSGSSFVSMDTPLTMEDVNQDYGYILYRTIIPPELRKVLVTITIDRVNDRSVIYFDGIRRAVVNRGPVHMTVPGGKLLEVLVENQGRLCYGSRGMKYLPDPKGILGNVKINSQKLKNWTMFPLNNSQLLKPFHWMNSKFDLAFAKDFGNHERSNMFFMATFQVQKVADTFIYMQGWVKGQIFINSFNIGRYWQLKKGPQKTLYVPRTVLRKGLNRVLIVELDAAPCGGGGGADRNTCSVEFLDKPILI